MTEKQDIALSLVDAEDVLGIIEQTMTYVIDASLEAADYGDVQKLGKEMEMLHDLRRAQLLVETAMQESANG